MPSVFSKLLEKRNKNIAIEADVVTVEENGVMSSSDKTKLDTVETGANNYILPQATTNSLGGIKLYTEIGNNTDGTVNQAVLTTALAGKAASSHGNHVPATETANNAKFLRNDNTWQTVTPANIGAATSSHTHNYAGSSSAGGPANSVVLDVSSTAPTIGTLINLPLKYKTKTTASGNAVFETTPFFAYPTSDSSNNGTGFGVCTGGALALGAGESARSLISNISLNGSTENLYLCADGSVNVYTRCDNISNKIGFTFDTSGNLTATKFTGPLTGNVTGNCSGSAGSVAWGNVTGKPSTFSPSSHSHSDYQYWVQKTIDLSSSTYNVNTWYPVTGSSMSGGDIRHILVDVELNSGTKPAWCTHSNGFTVILDMLITGGGWGTTSALSICLQHSCNFVSDTSKPPASYSQMNNSSTPVLWLRGGGKYFVWTNYSCTWTPRTSTYTVSSQSVAPTTTYPALSFSQSTIYANLNSSTVTTSNLALKSGITLS